MFFDLMYEIGGDALVRLSDAIVGPIFEWVADVAASFGNVGFWEILATMLEAILS